VAHAPRIVIGTAGWSIPRAVAHEFPGVGSHLERYARVFHGAEINSSFHRPHARAVYERWAATTPSHFRFSVKLLRTITHDGELRRARVGLETFLQQVSGLGEKLGPLLVQLPPSLAFNARVAKAFFEALRAIHDGHVVCEPRHPTWFEAKAEELLVRYRVGRVATDPSRIRAALAPGGCSSDQGVVTYYRLHGSPRKYWSRYPLDRIQRWAEELKCHAAKGDVWCIFDNTASGAAAENALEMAAEITRHAARQVDLPSPLAAPAQPPLPPRPRAARRRRR
jgi:uncharacterized protein YecE (DUF72 family)